MVTTSDRCSAALARLEDQLEFMNDDEQEVMTELMEIVSEIGAGIVRGQKLYGYMNLDNDERDHLAESDEEDRDWVTYRLMDMGRDRIRRRRAAPNG